MRNAAIALLAVPILVAVYFGTLLRPIDDRPGRPRDRHRARSSGSVFVGASGRRTDGRDPADPDRPLDPGGLQTTVVTDHVADGPGHDHLQHADGPRRRSPRRSRSTHATAVDLTWDATSTAMTIAPTTNWAAGTLHTDLRSGRCAGPVRPAARAAGHARSS